MAEKALSCLKNLPTNYRCTPVLAIIFITLFPKRLKGYIRAVIVILLCSSFVGVDLTLARGMKMRGITEKENSSLYNLKLLGKELVKYTQNHNGFLPDADRWCDILMQQNAELTENNFKHPKPEMFYLIGECHFAFNKNLSGKHMADIPGDVTLLFESDGKWNLNGAGKLLAAKSDEQGYIRMLFIDQSIANYWYNKQAIRKFAPSGKSMYYKKPRWFP